MPQEFESVADKFQDMKKTSTFSTFTSKGTRIRWPSRLTPNAGGGARLGLGARSRAILVEKY